MFDYVPVDYTSPPAIYAAAEENLDHRSRDIQTTTKKAIELIDSIDKEFIMSSPDLVNKPENEILYSITAYRWRVLMGMLQYYSKKSGNPKIYPPFSPDEGDKSRDTIDEIERSVCYGNGLTNEECINVSFVISAAMGTTRTVESINQRFGKPKGGWMNYIYHK